MKKIIMTILVIFCLIITANICNAQKTTKAMAPDVPAKVTAIVAAPVKPIVPGGESKAPQKILALPLNYDPTEIKDRTHIPEIKLPVDNSPLAAKPVVKTTQVSGQ